MSSTRNITARRNNQYQQQTQPLIPQQQSRIRTSQFGGQQQQPIQQQQQQGIQNPQDGGKMTVQNAINHTSFRLLKLEHRVGLLERNGVSSSVNELSSIGGSIDDTVINDIIERLDNIEDWINVNNNDNIQQSQMEIMKQLKMQNDKIIKLENELKKKPKIPQPIPQPIIQQQPQMMQQQQHLMEQQQGQIMPRRFNGNRNQPKPVQSIMELTTDNNIDNNDDNGNNTLNELE